MVLFAVAAVPAHAAERIVPLAEAMLGADAVVVATVDDPSTDQTVLPLAGAGNFVRMQWRFRIDEIVVGKTQRAKALRPGALIRVDEAQWRRDQEAQRACQGRQPCPAPEKAAYASDLSREPRPRQKVLALLRWTTDGWQLTLERAMDTPAKAAQVRTLRESKPAARRGR